MFPQPLVPREFLALVAIALVGVLACEDERSPTTPSSLESQAAATAATSPAAAAGAMSITLPVNQWAPSSFSIFRIGQTGGGAGGEFFIDRTSNRSAALIATTNGTGPVINAWTTTGGPAGWFRVLGPNNTKRVIVATTAGRGDVIFASAGGVGSAGRFVNTSTGPGVVIVTSGGAGLSVSGGTKNAVVATTSGSRALYSEEATEVWFADYGFGQLKNGRARILIDPAFAQTVSLDEPYHVFIQPYGDAELYVQERSNLGFVVIGRDGDPNAEFGYRVVAKRSGFEAKRLERAAWADDNPPF